jgi:hypothetical protein
MKRVWNCRHPTDQIRHILRGVGEWVLMLSSRRIQLCWRVFIGVKSVKVIK